MEFIIAALVGKFIIQGRALTLPADGTQVDARIVGCSCVVKHEKYDDYHLWAIVVGGKHDGTLARFNAAGQQISDTHPSQGGTA